MKENLLFNGCKGVSHRNNITPLSGTFGIGTDEGPPCLQQLTSIEWCGQ